MPHARDYFNTVTYTGIHHCTQNCHYKNILTLHLRVTFCYRCECMCVSLIATMNSHLIYTYCLPQLSGASLHLSVSALPGLQKRLICFLSLYFMLRQGLFCWLIRLRLSNLTQHMRLYDFFSNQVSLPTMVSCLE